MRKPRTIIALLRIALGWLFLYQGIAAILQPTWTLATYIKNPSTFAHFYTFLGSSPTVDYATYAVKGLFVLIGALLILGAWTRIAAFLGIILMLFFYFPLLHFPYVTSVYGSSTYYIVDEHIMYILVLMYLFTVRSGEYFGLGSMFKPSRY